jgi:hypothetical protein
MQVPSMGDPAISLLACLAAIYALAVAIFPIIWRRDAYAIVTVFVACCGIVASLFIIPREHVVLRALAALVIVDLVFRVIDFARQRWRGEIQTAGWADYFGFLIPFPWLLAVFGQKNRRLRVDQRSTTDLLRLLLGLAGTVLGFALLFAANKSSALQSSFLLDHITKLFIYVLAIESIAQALCGLERLVGFDTRPLFDRVHLARTPADFWRRANTRSQAWLYLNVFVPSGGRRALSRGIWATFLVSGLLHEIAFDIATSRITGYQLIFFLLQGPAVLYSPRLDRLARTRGIWGAALAHAATILWFATTSIFFFAGVDRIFPFFYTSDRWLP